MTRSRPDALGNVLEVRRTKLDSDRVNKLDPRFLQDRLN